MKKYTGLCLLLLILASCSVSYKFNAVSIDYTKIKTMEIRDFQNQTSLAPPLYAQEFSESMKDYFAKNTKLKFVRDAPADLEIEGEIVRYDYTPVSTASNTDQNIVAPKTRLTVSVKMRYRNNVEPDKDKDETFTTFRDFDVSTPIETAQATINPQITKEIVDQIFNATLSTW